MGTLWNAGSTKKLATYENGFVWNADGTKRLAEYGNGFVWNAGGTKKLAEYSGHDGGVAAAVYILELYE